MLSKLVGLSPEVKAYGDGDPEYFERRRLLDLNDVAAQLSRERNRYTLIKPLCETQRAEEILEAIPKAKALWIFRHYEPCIRSHMSYYKQFHDGLSYVREMLDLNVPCWKNENLSEDIRAFLRKQRSDSLNVQTTYALYWLARNSLFRGDLPEHRALLINYEHVLADPARAAAAIFSFLGVPFKPAYARLISAPASNSRLKSEVLPEVAERCQQLYRDLLTRVAHFA